MTKPPARHHPGIQTLFCLATLALIGLAGWLQPSGLWAAPTITYVQGNYTTPQTPQTTVKVTFTAAQAAGDLNVVVVGWNDSTATVSSVADSSGNAYTLAVGPTVRSGSLSQSIYYAKNIASAAAGANTVTVTFSAAAAYPDIRILEYAGADPNNPVDVTAAASGSSKTSTSASATTSNPTDLIFGANMVYTSTTGAGSGFTKRLLTSPDADLAEDKMVTATGSYSTTAPLSSSGSWIMQMVAFRTPSGSGGNFTLSASPGSLSVAQGNQGTSTITTTVSGGFSSAITLSAAGAPAGTTVSFSPGTIAAPGAGSSTMTLTVGSSTAVGTYSITVTGSGGGLQQSVTATLTVTAGPSFTLSASPASVSVLPGNQGTSTLTTTVSGGFNNAITLSASGAPTGTTVSFSPSTIGAPGAGTSTMTMTVGSTTAPGTYPITVTGNGGGMQQNATITLTVAAISTTISYVQGNYATPQSPQSTVSVTFNATQAAGDMNVVVVGWNDTTSSVTAVTDSSGNTYSLAAGPTTYTVYLSQSVYYAKNIAGAAAGANTVTVTFSPAATNPDIRISEYSGADPNNPMDVTTAASGSSSTSSSGAASTSNPTDLIFGANMVYTSTTGPGSGFTKRLLTSPDGDIAEDEVATAAGSYTASAPLGSSGPWVMQMVAFRTPSGSGGNFTLSASPGSPSVAQGNQGTSTITTTVSGGFSSAITLSAAGAPAGTTVSFSPGTIAAPGAGSSTMTLTVGSSTAVGTSPITVTGSGGGLQQRVTVTLTVTAGPSFTLSASPASVSVLPGNQGTSTVTTTVSGGFNNPISLSATGAPTGTTVSFSPGTIAAPGAGTSTMTVSVGTTTAPGTYPITVTGNGGGIQQNATITLTVAAISTTISYVQGNYATPQSPQSTVSVTFNATQAAGDMNVVVVGWNDTTATVASVTDQSGNIYALAVGPTLVSGALSQSIYYAKSILPAAAGANAVKVSFSTASISPDIRILEYSGADPSNPVDVTAAESGSGTTSSSGAANTTNPTDLIFGANIVTSVTRGPGSGFTQRLLTSPDGDIAEDEMVTAAGSYTATAPLSSGAWIMQMVAFSTSAGGPPAFSVSPRASVVTFTETEQFTTRGGGGSVTWSVDGVVGGSSSSGTITTNGLYTPPSSVGSHMVTATPSQGQTANATVYVSNYPGTYTYHNDNLRTGVNNGETVLTSANVNSAQFGKLFSYALDGIAFASPLYVANVNIPQNGYHNVVYVATENDSVYAFDADGRSATPLWHVSFLKSGVTPVPCADVGECGDIPDQIGITGTPVIDQSSGTLYVVAKTEEGTQYVQRLHALDITTGAEKFGGPVVLQGSTPGSGDGTSGGNVSFDPLHENQRPALLLSNGVVYVGFASHGDNHPWHGWVLGYSAATLQQVLVYNVTPNGYGGGIWQGGGGLAGDADGNIYFTTGNGTFDVNTGGTDYGDSVEKLTAAGKVPDYFTPHDQSNMEANDLDLGAGGPVLLIDQTGGPYPHLLVSAGKTGTIYVINRDSMGGYSPNGDGQIVQTLVGTLASGGAGSGNFSTPVYFDGFVYFAARNDTLKAFQFSNGLLSTSPTSESAATYPCRGGSFAVSANGSSNGILWAIQNLGDPNNDGTTPGVLIAYNANDLGQELYDTNQAGSRDTMDYPAKFAIPLVANGKVFVAGQTQLVAYGLLP